MTENIKFNSYSKKKTMFLASLNKSVNGFCDNLRATFENQKCEKAIITYLLCTMRT